MQFKTAKALNISDVSQNVKRFTDASTRMVTRAPDIHVKFYLQIMETFQ